jgi:mRNA interferase MazF
MRRGDVVVVAAAGDYGKPRPAVVIQTDALSDAHPSVILCPMTSAAVDAPHLRVTIDPSDENGLRLRSQVMADKPVTVHRKRIGQRVGRLAAQDVARLNAALAFVLGIAD